jgi:hypothetical protein
MVEQKENLVCLQIEQAEKPVIQMLTEAGMIGKIGECRTDVARSVH